MFPLCASLKTSCSLKNISSNSSSSDDNDNNNVDNYKKKKLTRLKYNKQTMYSVNHIDKLKTNTTSFTNITNSKTNNINNNNNKLTRIQNTNLKRTTSSSKSLFVKFIRKKFLNGFKAKSMLTAGYILQRLLEHPNFYQRQEGTKRSSKILPILDETKSHQRTNLASTSSSVITSVNTSTSQQKTIKIAKKKRSRSNLAQQQQQSVSVLETRDTSETLSDSRLMLVPSVDADVESVVDQITKRDDFSHQMSKCYSESYLNQIQIEQNEEAEDEENDELLNDKFFKFYHVVLERTQLENWNSNTSDDQDDELNENLTIVTHKPQSKARSLTKLVTSTTNLNLGELELWSNLDNNNKQIVNSMSKSIGSITDQFILHTLINDDNENTNNTKEENVNDLKTQSYKESSTTSEKYLIKLNDSGYATVPHNTTQSRLGSTSNEDEDNESNITNLMSPKSFMTSIEQKLSLPPMTNDFDAQFTYVAIDLDEDKSITSQSGLESSLLKKIKSRTNSTEVIELNIDLISQSVSSIGNRNAEVDDENTDIESLTQINNNNEEEELFDLNEILLLILNEIIEKIEATNNEEESIDDFECLSLSDNNINIINHNNSNNENKNNYEFSNHADLVYYEINYKNNENNEIDLLLNEKKQAETNNNTTFNNKVENKINNLLQNNRLYDTDVYNYTESKTTTTATTTLVNENKNICSQTDQYIKDNITNNQTNRKTFRFNKNRSVLTKSSSIIKSKSEHSNQNNESAYFNQNKLSNSTSQSCASFLQQNRKHKRLSSLICSTSTSTTNSSSSSSNYSHNKMMSPLKKKSKLMSQDPVTTSHECDISNEDEFFLAISSSSKLQTGSCPDFYWYPFTTTTTPNNINVNESNEFIEANKSHFSTRRRTKSFNDMSIKSSIKSYENITHSNYVQMVNSMITGAISDVADLDYIEYVKRHIQGLFDNFSPVLLKSRSNEEIAITSPSRDQIIELINSSIPKSFSFDLKFLEDNKLDPMDFSKFGLGIENNGYDTKNSFDASSSSNKLNSIESNDLLISENVDGSEYKDFIIFDLNETSSRTVIDRKLMENDTTVEQFNSSNENDLVLKMNETELENENENETLLVVSTAADSIVEETFEANLDDTTKAKFSNENNRTFLNSNKMNKTKDESFSTIVQSNVTMTTDDDIENNLSNTLLANTSANSINVNNTNNNNTLAEANVTPISIVNKTLIDILPLEITTTIKRINSQQNDQFEIKEENLSNKKSVSSIKSIALSSSHNDLELLNEEMNQQNLIEEDKQISNLINDESLNQENQDETGVNSSYIIDTFENHFKEILDYDDEDDRNEEDNVILVSSVNQINNALLNEDVTELKQQRQRCSSLHDNKDTVALNETSFHDLFVISNSSTSSSSTTTESVSLQTNNLTPTTTGNTTQSPISAVSSSNSNSNSNTPEPILNEPIKDDFDSKFLSSSSSSSSSNDLIESTNFSNYNDDLIEIVNQIVKQIETNQININYQQSQQQMNQTNQNEFSSNDSFNEDLNKNDKQKEQNENLNQTTTNKPTDLLDEFEIECKVDYFIKESTDGFMSSSTTSSSSLIEVNSSNERESDYENMNESMLNCKLKTNNFSVDTKYTLNESHQIEAEEDSDNSQTSLDKFVAFNDLISKSNSDEEDENEEYSPFNFIDEFTDLNKELDENWMQDDELIFGTTLTNNKPPPPLNHNHKLSNILNHVYKPRFLHRIDEETSITSDTNEKTQINLEDDLHERKELKCAKDVKVVSILKREDTVESSPNEPESFSYTTTNTISQENEVDLDDTTELEKQQEQDESISSSSESSVATTSSQTKEKLRTKQCDIDSLLGGMISTYEQASHVVEVTYSHHEATIQENDENIENISTETEYSSSRSDSTEEPDATNALVNKNFIQNSKEATEKDLDEFVNQELIITAAAAEEEAKLLNEIQLENDLYYNRTTRLTKTMSQTEAATENDASDFESDEYLINNNNNNQKLSEDVHSQQLLRLERDEELEQDVLEVRQDDNKSTLVDEKLPEIVVSQSESFINRQQQQDSAVEIQGDLEFEKNESHSHSIETSNENFEIVYECQIEKDEEKPLIKKSESEIDISNLRLNISTVDDDLTSTTNEQFIQVIQEIEKQIDEPTSASALVRPTTLILKEINEQDEEEEDDEEDDETYYDETIITNKRLVESTSWPILATNKHMYELKDDVEVSSNNLISLSITADRINEAEHIYIGLPEETNSNQIEINLNNDPIPTVQQLVYKCDKSDQVNPLELKKMIDTETQMTPPISPVKETTRTTTTKTNTKVSVATETDQPEIFITNIQISNEEELLMKKLIEKENLLKSQSIATQTASIEEIMNEMKLKEQILVENDIEEERVEQKVEEEKENDLSLVEDDLDENNLNDQRCLNLLQDMKKMDDDLKLELSKLNSEDETKSELFDLIKNLPQLDAMQRDKLESLIKLNAKNKDLNLICSKLNNLSLDNCLKSLIDNLNQEEEVDEVEENDENNQLQHITNSTNKNKIISNVESQSSSSPSSSTSSVTSSSTSLSNRSEPLLIVDINQPNKKSKKSQLKTNTKSELAVQTDSLQIKPNDNLYNSHFIDLLSLNLERSKTWVEMTEAKLNYMIGETDAVLRSMCFESSDEEKGKTKDYERHSTDSSSSSSSSPRIETKSGGVYSSSSSTNLKKQQQQQTNIQEMTKLYLDNYKRQLQESKNDLNSKINLLDKEKEKVCRIRDLKKRELYMRRQAAIEAFRLERERELNAQISKIDELRGAIDECKSELNTSTKTQHNYDNVKELNELLKCDDAIDTSITSRRHLPSQNREKLAKLRRNLILNSSLNNASDIFNTTQQMSQTTHYYDDYLNNSQSLNNTPRSCTSCFSNGFNDNRYKPLCDLNKENYQHRASYHVSSNGSKDYNRVEASSSSFIYKPTLTSSPNYIQQSTNSLNTNKQTSSSIFNSNSLNNNLNSVVASPSLTNPVMVMIPLRNRSFSSTPVAHGGQNYLNDEKQYNIPIEQVNNNNNTSISLNIERSRSNDTRLLIPVISTNTITTTTTMTNTTTINTTGLTNVKTIPTSTSNASLTSVKLSDNGGCATSIVDESRLLLREYEQLRNDSVSEIQRAHDSLNASLVWLENQKLNRMRSLLSSEQTSSSIYPKYTKETAQQSSQFTSNTSRTYNDYTGGGTTTTSNNSLSTRSVRLPIERQDLSPVSRFREEQKGSLFNTNLSSTTTKSNTTKFNTNNNNTNKYSFRQENSIPVYSSSLLYSELPTTTTASRQIQPIYKPKTNPFKNTENQTSQINCFAKNPSSKHEKTAFTTESTRREKLTNYNTNTKNNHHTYRLYNNEDDKLY